MDVADLSVKLNVLINDRGAVDAVKEQAKHYVLRNHSWNSVTDRIENLYKSLYYSEKTRLKEV